MEIQEFVIALTSTILSLSLVGFIFYYFFHIRNKERMALIEKGADASMFYTPKKQNPLAVLKWALLIIGLAFGLFVAVLLDTLTDLQEPIYFAMIFLFGGLGLLTYYFIARRNVQNGDK
jgi:hypothetical protein